MTVPHRVHYNLSALPSTKGRCLGACVRGYVCLCGFHCHCVLIGPTWSQIRLHFQGRKKGIPSRSDRLRFSRRFLVFSFLEVSTLLAARVQLRARAMRFPTQWAAAFCYLFLGRGKGGQVREMSLRCHFLHSFICWFGFIVKDC